MLFIVTCWLAHINFRPFYSWRNWSFVTCRMAYKFYTPFYNWRNWSFVTCRMVKSFRGTFVVHGGTNRPSEAPRSLEALHQIRRRGPPRLKQQCTEMKMNPSSKWKSQAVSPPISVRFNDFRESQTLSMNRLSMKSRGPRIWEHDVSSKDFSSKDFSSVKYFSSKIPKWKWILHPNENLRPFQHKSQSVSTISENLRPFRWMVFRWKVADPELCPGHYASLVHS